MTRAEDNPPPQPAELLARLFGTSVEEMRERPEAAREKFAAAFRELAESHEPSESGSPGGGAYNAGAAREMMRRLRRELAASGEEVPAELDELPAQLAAVAERLGGATPEELAALLRGLAAAVETPTREGVGSGEGGEADEGRANLDEVAAWFETNFGTLLGFERRRRKEDARMQAEYREAAKRSIAASLREHGIQPLSTDPEPVAPRASIKRHRLFWQEFAAAADALRSLVAEGEEEDVEAARRRVAGMLDAFDLDLKIRLTREGEEAVLAFIPSDDVAANVALQVVVRDSPRLPGWRFVRGSRYGPAT